MATQNKNLLMAKLAAWRLVEHVKNGGWLGASWPHYACGIKTESGRIVQSGYDCFSDEQLELAVHLAVEQYPQLWDIAQQNFTYESEEQERAIS